MNHKLKTNGALLVGPVVSNGDLKTGMTLGVAPENRALFIALSKSYRVRRNEDGWFVDNRGHRRQIWEFGIRKLGLTIVGGKSVKKCLTAGDWLHRKSIGNDEANFFCDWTDANLINLATLAKLQRRKKRVLHPRVENTLTDF